MFIFDNFIFLAGGHHKVLMLSVSTCYLSIFKEIESVKDKSMKDQKNGNLMGMLFYYDFYLNIKNSYIFYFKKSIAFISILVALLYVNISHAAMFCYFENGGSTTYISVPSGNNIEINPLPQGSSGWIGSARVPGELTSQCKAGSGYQFLYSGWAQNSTDLGKYNTNGKSYPIAFFNTNVPGIYYTIRIKSATTPPTGYLSYRDEEIIYDIDDSVDTQWLWGTKHYLYVDVYQHSSYRGLNGYKSVYPAGSASGAFRYSSWPDTRIFTSINSQSFTFPVKAASCTAQIDSSDGRGNTNINLGTVTSQQISEGKAPYKWLDIYLTNCNGAASETKVKFSSTSVSQNGLWLKDTNGNTGAALEISHWNSKDLWKPGTTHTHYLPNDRLKMGARLVQDGVVQSGNFKANATFQIDYN